MSPKKKKEKKSFTIKTFIKDTVGIVLLVSVALLVKSNTVELFKIPTGSMEPTLFGANDLGKGFGDHLFVKRWSYGLSSKVKIPIIGVNLPLPKYHIFKKDPKVGDVVVFESPRNSKIDYIKRCCGVPGDRVSIKDGNLFVNGEIKENSSKTEYKNMGILSDSFIKIAHYVNAISKVDDSIKDAVFINGKSYRIIEAALKARQVLTTEKHGIKSVHQKAVCEILVPEDSFFMLGDNSEFSSDSRFWGFANSDKLKGEAWIVYLPLNRIKLVR